MDAFAATAPLVSIDVLASSADARDRVVVEHAAALFLERGIAGVKMTDIAEAAERGIQVAQKPDSHDICFIPSGDTAGFLNRHLGSTAGDFVDLEGEVVGAHAGSHQFTVGQRRGLRLGVPATDGRPRYVLGIEPAGNRVVVGPHEALAVSVIDGIRPSWAEQPVYGPWRGLVQVRAHGEPLAATIDGRPDGITVALDAAAHGIAPGQAVVCYDGDRVIGSSVISSAVRSANRAA